MEVHRILGFDQFRGNSARKSVDFLFRLFRLLIVAVAIGFCRIIPYFYIINYPLLTPCCEFNSVRLILFTKVSFRRGW